MVPALTSDTSPQQHPDIFFSDAILHSWQLFIDVMAIPREVIDKWTSCELKLKHIWSPDALTPSSTSVSASHYRPSQSKQIESESVVRLQSKGCSEHKIEEKMETLSAATSLSDELSDVSPHRYKKNCRLHGGTKQTSSKTNSLDSLPHSPCRKLKRMDSEREMMDESGYMSSQHTHGSSEEDRVLSNHSEDGSNKSVKLPSMNPLAKPFIYKQLPSCDERIMADQLAVHQSFGVDEPIGNQFCSNFFPAMSTPQSFQAGNMQPNHFNPSQTVPEQTKPTFESANVFQSCQIPMNMAANNAEQISVNVSNKRQAQQIFVSAPVAPPPHPNNQQPPMLINAAIPPRCAWVPTRSLLLGPVNQPGVLQTPNILGHNLPQVQSQMLMPSANRIPLYLMQSQSNKPLPPPTTNQQYGGMCRPMMPATFVTAMNNQQNQDTVVNNQTTCGNPQVQKELIKSALELMKCRPSTVGRMQFTASRQ